MIYWIIYIENIYIYIYIIGNIYVYIISKFVLVRFVVSLQIKLFVSNEVNRWKFSENRKLRNFLLNGKIYILEPIKYTYGRARVYLILDSLLYLSLLFLILLDKYKFF